MWERAELPSPSWPSGEDQTLEAGVRDRPSSGIKAAGVHEPQGRDREAETVGGQERAIIVREAVVGEGSPKGGGGGLVS